MIRKLGESVGDAIVESVGRAVGRTQEQRPLPVDLLESDEAYLAVFDAPDAEAADVQVRFEDGKVFARVDRFREFHEGYEMRFPGRGLTLDGSVSLPAEAVVSPEDATATLTDNGTLQVKIPKVEPDVDDEVASMVSTMDEEGVKPERLEDDEEDAETGADDSDTDDTTNGVKGVDEDDETGDEDETADDAS